MEYILQTHDKLKFILDENEYGAYLKAIQGNDKVFIIKKYKAVVPLHITPSVVPVEIWYAQENERLALTEHRLCKKCLCTIRITDVCNCWEATGKNHKKNAFRTELPVEIRGKLNLIAQCKSFPKISDADVSFESPVFPKKQVVPSLSDDTADYYLDENGEKIYS